MSDPDPNSLQMDLPNQKLWIDSATVVNVRALSLARFNLFKTIVDLDKLILLITGASDFSSSGRTESPVS